MEGADSTGHNFPTTKPHILSLKARKCPERIKPGLVTSSALPLLLSAKEGQRVVRRRPAPHRCAPPQATAFSPQILSAECGRALHMRGATPAAVPLRKVRPSPTSEPSRAAAPPAPRFPGAAGHGRPGGPLPAFFSQNTQSLNRDEAMNFSQGPPSYSDRSTPCGTAQTVSTGALASSIRSNPTRPTAQPRNVEREVKEAHQSASSLFIGLPELMGHPTRNQLTKKDRF